MLKSAVYLHNTNTQKQNKMENSIEITELENKVLMELIEGLYAEPSFSDVDTSDLAEWTKLEVNTVKGVLGSLTKKDIIEVGEYDFSGLIYLREPFWNLHPEWSEETKVEQIKVTIK